PPEPLWEVEAAGKAFVDLQNDVTAADVRLACREGYEHLEHMKRYTTHGMATDQGRSGGLVGAAVLARARGVALSAVGMLRPRPYAQPGGWEPVLEEARAVRNGVGLTDVSTLGKIDVQGPDAARFLDFIYANTFSTLAVGRTRYGIMLREDGMLLDDGTTARLGPQQFLVTTTTANAAAVLEHMEFHLQTVCHELDVVLTDVGDQWAQFALAGP